MIYILNGLMPLLSAGLSAWLIGVDIWDGIKQGLLVALSVVAAGVLVRLARGMPFNSVDHYEVNEIRDLTMAVVKIVRSLRVLVGFVLMAMVLITSAIPLQKFLHSASLTAAHGESLDRCISAVIGLSLTYVIVRMSQVVSSDVDLTVLQSKFVVRAVERKQARLFDSSSSSAALQNYRPPENYGKVIQ